MNEKVLKEIVDKYPNEVKYPYGEVINLIGVDNLFKLSANFGGCSIYFPRPRNIFKNSIDSQIREEFDGCNYQKLASKYELCERSIRNITDYKK